MNQHIRYHQMSIKCQYMSNICQAQTKGERDNKTDKRNKREQEKGPRDASRSKGLKASSSLWWFREGFPLTGRFCYIECKLTDIWHWCRCCGRWLYDEIVQPV